MIVTRCFRANGVISYHTFHVAIAEYFAIAHLQTDSRQWTPRRTSHRFAVANVEPAFVAGTVHSPQIGSRQDGTRKMSALLPVRDKVRLRKPDNAHEN